MSKLFKLDIFTPERVFFSDYVESVIINTAGGELGILYNAEPLVSTLEFGTIKIMQKGKWTEAANSTGFVEVNSSGVTIMAQTCMWPHEINMERLDSEIDEAAERQKRKQSLQEYKIAKAQLQRQFAKLKIKKYTGD